MLRMDTLRHAFVELQLNRVEALVEALGVDEVTVYRRPVIGVACLEGGDADVLLQQRRPATARRITHLAASAVHRHARAPRRTRDHGRQPDGTVRLLQRYPVDLEPTKPPFRAGFRLPGQRAYHVVGLDALHLQQRQAEQAREFEDGLHLLAQFARHGRPIGLVFLEHGMPEGRALDIEKHGGKFRFPVFHQFHEHFRKAENGVCGKPLGVG